MKRSENNKSVHISVDDVTNCLQKLTYENPDSIFEISFFRYLRFLHKNFGAKFTLYIYVQFNKWVIEDIPNQYRLELNKVSDWLKIACHSFTHEESEMKYAIDKNERFIDAVKRTNEVFGISSAKIVRLHYWFYPNDYINTLMQMGVTTILINKKDLNVSSGKLEEWVTDIQLENDLQILKTIFQKKVYPLVIFTHEWSLDIRNKLRLTIVVLFLSIMKYKYICN